MSTFGEKNVLHESRMYFLYGLRILVDLKYIRREKLPFMYFRVFNIFNLCNDYFWNMFYIKHLISFGYPCQ